MSIATEGIPNLAHWPTTADVMERLGVTYRVLNAWIKRGVKAECGRIRLHALKVGGVWRIDPAAVEPFLRRVTAAALGEGVDVVPPPESATAGRRRVKESMARLKAAGVGGGDDAEWIHTVGHPSGRRKPAHRIN